MKFAITGKGGVGKTTLVALLAQTFADQNRLVFAVDADPSPCLAGALGFPMELQAKLTPIAEMDELIYERTGARPGSSGGFFTINPRVDDLPERFSVVYRNVRLLEMGAIDSGGSGCICPESAMLKTLFTHMLFRKDDIIIFDMYAGVEHLGRATVDFVDGLIIVIEPTKRSIGTARQIQSLANDIGLTSIWLVANKVRNEKDSQYISKEISDVPMLGTLPFSDLIYEADRLGKSAYDHIPELKSAGKEIAESIIKKFDN